MKRDEQSLAQSKKAQYQREWWAKNPEYRAKKALYQRAWWAKHPEKHGEYNARQKEKDPDRVRLWNKEWRENHAEKSGEYCKRWRQQNPEKAVVHNIVRHAIESGKLERPAECEMCGESVSEGHHQDYAKPLEVIWLCRACHNHVHRYFLGGTT